HRDDRHLADQELLRDPRGRRGRGSARAAHGVRTGRRLADGGAAMRVAVVGATGAVGTRMLQVLAERRFPADSVRALASERSAGKEVEFGNDTIHVEALDAVDLSEFDLALFSAGGAVSEEWAPKFVAAGAVVVDNSSFWRMQDDVPLVVAEVNPDAIDSHRGIVANPNCSTMQMVVALKPIDDAAGIERLVISTYQSVSGTG